MTRDARMVVAFTGLASVGDFPDGYQGPPPPGSVQTEAWILEALTSVAPPDHMAVPMIERFSTMADAQLAMLQVRREVKGLAVIFVGYTYTDSSCESIVYRVANFEDDPRAPRASFAVTRLNADHPRASYVVTDGTRHAVEEAEQRSLLRLSEQGKPASALVGKALDIVRTAAQSPRARNAIGKQCTSVVLPADPALPATSEYHSEIATSTLYGVNHVEARGGAFGVYSMMNPSFSTEPEASGSPQLLTGPVRGRKKPCWCGSGLKYKRCQRKRLGA